MTDKYIEISKEAPYTCQYCGRPSWLEPFDQTPPPDYCHESDHGTAEAEDIGATKP